MKIQQVIVKYRSEDDDFYVALFSEADSDEEGSETSDEADVAPIESENEDDVVRHKDVV